MTFDALPAAPNPLAPLDARTELLLAGTWTDISQYVQKDAVVIGRGHPDESTTTAASTLAMTLNNTDGRFTAKNPSGPYYGSLGRNVQCRISFPEGASYLRLEQDTASGAQCPDSAGVSITGDTDIQVDVTLDNWNADAVLACKWAQTSNERSWFFSINQDGTLRFRWSPDGTLTNSVVAVSTMPVVQPPLLRQCLRVTLAVATGTVTFWTAPRGNLAGASWTQLGATVVLGAHSVFDSTAPVQAAWASDAAELSHVGLNGKVHALQLLSGIAGTVKASPDFTAQTAGATSFSDAQSNTWTLQGTAELSTRKYRCHVEIPSWPQNQDSSGKTVYANVSGGGLLRRTGQAQATVSSAMTRAYLRLPSSLQLAGYWPAEDGANATAIASGIGGQAMTFTGKPKPASSTAFACSSALPVMNGATLIAPIPANSLSWTANVIRFLWAPPAAGETNGAVVARVYTTGTVKRLDLFYGTGGTLDLNGYDGSGTQLFTTNFAAFGINGGLWRVSVELTTSGSNVGYGIVTVAPGASSGLVQSGTLTSATVGAVTKAEFGSAGISQSAMGQFSVQATEDSLFDLGLALAANAGETAGNRFARLCSEEGWQFRGRGNLADTAAMGPQTQQTVIALLQECVDADLGIMTELRQQLGFGYRTRPAIGNQLAAVTLSYNSDHLDIPTSPPLEDEQIIVNDVTVTQTSDGSMARQFAQAGQPIDGGRLSIDDPSDSPPGAGRYDQQYQVNLNAGSQLNDNAGWRLRMGTVDEPRYPGIGVDLVNTALASLWYDLLDMDLGDRLTITNPPVFLPPGTIDQVLNGAQETFFVAGILGESFQGVPYSPWCSGYAGGDPEGFFGWADTDGSALHLPVSSSVTSLVVETTGAVNAGVFLNEANISAADFNGAAALWSGFTGQPVAVTRVYEAASVFAYTADMIQMVAAGVKLCIDFKPAFNPVSATDLANLTTVLQTMTAAGAVCDISLWHEPFFSGLSAAQYVAMIQFYGPAVRQFYPLFACLSGNDTIAANGYYPGDAWVDGIAVDAYAFSGTSQIVAAASLSPGKPFGIWEFGSSAGINNLTGDATTFSATIANWLGAGNCNATHATTPVYGISSGSLKMSSVAAGTMSAASCAAANFATQMLAVSPGDEIVVSEFFRALAATPRSCQVGADFYTSGGVLVSTVFSADATATVTDGAGGWAGAFGTLTAPPTAAWCRLKGQVNSTAGAAEVHFGALAHLSNATAAGQTKAQATAFFQFLQAFMTGRTAAGLPNGNMLLFDSGVPGTSIVSVIDNPGDYRISLYQALTQAGPSPLWTTSGGDMPFDISCGGEQMTVTAISGTTSPQAFTVTRSVNGVVKAHAAGSDVRLAFPAIVSM